MKKSEMINYLAKNLRRKDKCVTTNMDQCRYLVKLVLDSCETKGMFPPPLNESVVEYDEDTNSCFVKVWSWEPEDE